MSEQAPEVKGSKTELKHSHLPGMWPWTSHLTSESNFLICKMETIHLPYRFIVEKLMSQYLHKAPRTVLDTWEVPQEFLQTLSSLPKVSQSHIGDPAQDSDTSSYDSEFGALFQVPLQNMSINKVPFSYTPSYLKIFFLQYYSYMKFYKVFFMFTLLYMFLFSGRL